MKVDPKMCMRCGGCVAVCPKNAIELKSSIKINSDCIECRICEKFCPMGAISK